jgi:serine/threonine-protein kinase
MTKGQSNPTLEQLGEELRSFLNSAYQSEPDFQMSLPVEQPDKTSKIEWSFTAKGDNGAKGTLQGDSYILQVADKVAIVTFIAPQEQFNDLEPAFNQIFSSYKIYRQVDLPQQPLP